MRRYAHTTSLLLLLFFMFHLVVSEISSNQRNTMINLYNLLQNNTDESFFPWNSIRDPCSWKGVTCNVHNSSITLFSLQFFSLSNPDFLPVLCQIDTLESIDLSNNYLSSIPSGFLTNCGKLSGLRGLNFSTNRLSGSLPNFDGFLKLEFLDLSHNSLSGTISLQMDGLVSLKNLSLGYNQFIGSVPTHLGKTMILERLGLYGNHFVGKIPEEIANYSKLTVIDLSFNNLSGSIPASIGNLNSLIELQLGSNGLGGKIPLMPQSLLIALNLSSNQFEGLIPETLSRLNGLEVLDLSNNSFTGQIPDFFVTMESLTQLVLSHNRLFGLIPKFRSYVLVDTTGNTGLIEPTNPSPTQKTKKTPTLFLVIGGGVFAICIATMLVLWISDINGFIRYFCFRKTQKIQSEARTTNHGNIFSIWNYDGRIAYEDIIKATNDFDIRYCIGRGGYGSVYRAQLPSGKLVALKKLHRLEAENPVFDHSFRNEVQMLTNIRHRNIVKLYGFCLHNRCMFLVYEYMEKGSLFCALRFDVESSEIGWTQRVNIVEGMAHALSYLHHDCTPPIVHRDISSNNILLNSQHEELRDC